MSSLGLAFEARQHIPGSCLLVSLDDNAACRAPHSPLPPCSAWGAMMGLASGSVHPLPGKMCNGPFFLDSRPHSEPLSGSAVLLKCSSGEEWGQL